MTNVCPEAVRYEENNEWKEINNMLKAVGVGVNAILRGRKLTEPRQQQQHPKPKINASPVCHVPRFENV